MSLYAFYREARGPFEKLLPFCEPSGVPGCLACEREARRAYPVPGVVSISAAQKWARLVDEKGSEPRITKKLRRRCAPRAAAEDRGR